MLERAQNISMLMMTLYQLSIWRLRCQVCSDLQVTIPCRQLLTQAFGRLQAICQCLYLCLGGRYLCLQVLQRLDVLLHITEESLADHGIESLGRKDICTAVVFVQQASGQVGLAFWRSLYFL